MMGSPDISDKTLSEMTRHLKPSWQIVDIDRFEDGINATAALDVETPTTTQRVVLKIATSSHPLANRRIRAEPRLLSLVNQETSIPVPEVLGICDDHETYHTPFFLMSYVDGESFTQDHVPDLPSDVRETMFREAGRNMAELHELGPLSAVGNLVYQNGEVTIIDTDDSPRYDQFHDWLLDHYEGTLDQIETNGGYFPDLTEDPTRFTDLVPELRQYLRETIPKLPAPGPPTYCHKDYRYGNLLVDTATGNTRAVLDWGILMSAPPAFNFALTEAKLLKPDLNDDPHAETGRTGELRQALYEGYAEVRDDWTPDEAMRERIHLYRLTYRLDAMACLPLWYRTDPTLTDRDTRAAEHRTFVQQYL